MRVKEEAACRKSQLRLNQNITRSPFLNCIYSLYTPSQALLSYDRGKEEGYDERSRAVPCGGIPRAIAIRSAADERRAISAAIILHPTGESRYKTVSASTAPLNQPSVPSSQIQASLLTLLKKCDSIGQQYLIQKRRAQIILAVILSVFALCAIGSVSDYSENASCSPTPTTLSSQVARFFPRLLKFPIKSRVSCSVIKRLRLDFPLITNGEIEGQFWWIVTSEQRDEVLDFARRNRLKLVEG